MIDPTSKPKWGLFLRRLAMEIIPNKEVPKGVLDLTKQSEVLPSVQSDPKKMYRQSTKCNRIYWRYTDEEQARREKEYKQLVYATQPWEERRQWILNDLRRTTGIVLTIDEFKVMHTDQNQSCKICHRPHRVV